MTPYQLINPANPASPIWIANQVARENAAREAVETSTAAETETTCDGDVEMVVVFSFTIVLALLFALFVAFMAAQELKNS